MSILVVRLAVNGEELSGGTYTFRSLQYGWNRYTLTVLPQSGEPVHYTLNMLRPADLDGSGSIDVRDIARAAAMQLDFNGDGSYDSRDAREMLAAIIQS